jgi:hypothetical protein
MPEPGLRSMDTGVGSYAMCSDWGVRRLMFSGLHGDRVFARRPACVLQCGHDDPQPCVRGVPVGAVWHSTAGFCAAQPVHVAVCHVAIGAAALVQSQTRGKCVLRFFDSLMIFTRFF